MNKTIEIPFLKDKVKISKEELIEWRKYYSIKEISKKTGYKYTTIQSLCQKYDIKICSSKCEKYKDQIIEDLKNKISYSNMEKKYDIKSDTIAHYVQKHNLREQLSSKDIIENNHSTF